MTSGSNNALKLITPELLEKIVSYYHLAGTAYIWKISAGRQVLSLQVLRNDRVQFVRESNHFQYTDDKNTYTIPVEDMVMIKNFNPFELNPYDP